MNIATLALLLCTTPALAATQATTTDGRQVTLNDDGTWTAATPAATPPGTDAAPLDLTCAKIIEVEEDAVTGKVYTSLADTIIISPDGKDGLTWRLLQMTGKVPGVIWTVGVYGASGCTDDDDKANILFTDGSRMELENDADFACDNDFTLYFGGSHGKKAQLAILASKDIKTMRVWTRDGYVEQSPTPDQAATLRAGFACLSH